jgi:hypothetical protein
MLRIVVPEFAGQNGAPASHYGRGGAGLPKRQHAPGAISTMRVPDTYDEQTRYFTPWRVISTFPDVCP